MRHIRDLVQVCVLNTISKASLILSYLSINDRDPLMAAVLKILHMQVIGIAKDKRRTYDHIGKLGYRQSSFQSII